MYHLHTYGVTEESGTWYICIDGEPARNVMYRHHSEAQTIADRLAETNQTWHDIFAIEATIDQWMIDNGRTWPYGATCVNHGTDDTPNWIIVEPYRDKDPSRPVTPSPTGRVQINVYNRDLYDAACAVAGIAAKTDAEISDNPLSSLAHSEFIEYHVSPIDAVAARIEYRRYVGIKIEEAAEETRRFERLQAAGLVHTNGYTRDEYIQACGIMGVDPLPDDTVPTIIAIDIANEVGIPTSLGSRPDRVTIVLAYQRSMLIAREQRADSATTSDGQ